MKKLAVIGSSDLAQLIAHHAVSDGHYIMAGFYDDYKEEGSLVDGIRISGRLNRIEEDFENGLFDCLMVGIGYKHMDFRKSIFETLSGKIPFGKIVHSSCYVDPSATIEAGCFLLPGCVIDRNVHVYENVLLNTGCVIAHDSSVSKHSFLSPAVKMAGFSKIGQSCIIGINATIIDNVVISEGIQVGAGAVVTKILNEAGLYVGCPAKRIK